MYSTVLYKYFNDVFIVINFYESFNKLLVCKFKWDSQTNKRPIGKIIYFINKNDKSDYKKIFNRAIIKMSIKKLCEILKIKIFIIWQPSEKKTDNLEINIEKLISKELKKTHSKYDKIFEQIEKNITEIKADITEIKADIIEIKADITKMKGDMGKMKGYMGKMQRTLEEFQKEVKKEFKKFEESQIEVKKELNQLREDLKNFKNDMHNVINTLEKKIYQLFIGLSIVATFTIILAVIMLIPKK